MIIVIYGFDNNDNLKRSFIFVLDSHADLIEMMGGCESDIRKRLLDVLF